MSNSGAAAKTQNSESVESSLRSPERAALAAAISARDEAEAEDAALRSARERALRDRMAARRAVEDAERALAEARERDKRELTASFVSGEPNAAASEVPAAEAALVLARRRLADLEEIGRELGEPTPRSGRSMRDVKVDEAIAAIVRGHESVRRLTNDYRAMRSAFLQCEATLIWLAVRRMIPHDLVRVAPSANATRLSEPDPAFVAAVEALKSNPSGLLPGG